MPVEFKFDQEKAIAAISYLTSRNIPDLSKGKLFKLLFLAEKYHLVTFGRTVTGDKYWAVKHGPIPSLVKAMLDALETGSCRELSGTVWLDKSFTYPRLSSKEPIAQEHLSESDRIALDHAIKHFGSLTFAQLRALTHEMPAYEKAWEARGNGNRMPMSFEDFFEEDDDAVAGAKEEMLENFIMREVFSTR